MAKRVITLSWVEKGSDGVLSGLNLDAAEHIALRYEGERYEPRRGFGATGSGKLQITVGLNSKRTVTLYPVTIREVLSVGKQLGLKKAKQLAGERIQLIHRWRSEFSVHQ